ncbi:restriction endonuclease subunit S [Corynebacterium sp. LK2510]|uniref:restriction endonuclease subunit S n=1 Tax=Corynebacterium sp. LK2510 TaxID=3110472 RepID=UPI0034CD3A2C
MSRIDDLIEELCPNGVEFMMLGDISTLVRGSGMPKKELTREGVGAIHYGQIYTFYGVWTTETKSFVASNSATKLAKVNHGDVIITNTSENIDDVGKAVAWLGDKPIVTGGHATVIKHGQDPRYLSYWFASSDFHAQKRKLTTGTKVVELSVKQLAKIRIPVPPLEIQREIVQILDKFTQLEAELEARRRQYEYYRSTLMSSKDAEQSAMISLADIFEMRAGTHISAANISDKPTDEKPYPCFGGNGLRGFVSSFNYNEPVILIGRQGALCGNVHRAEGRVYATEHAVVVTPKTEVDMSWAFHKLTEMQLNQYKTESAQPGLAVGRVKKIMLNRVPLDVQRSVGIALDNFDALVNDLSSGLPAEIAARRKQYEYYRDQLLTFKELSA